MQTRHSTINAEPRETIRRFLLVGFVTAAALILSACQSFTPPERENLVSLPESWETTPSSIDKSISEKNNTESAQATTSPTEDSNTAPIFNWSTLIDNKAFFNLARIALNNNPTLEQQKLAIDIAEAQLRASGMSLYIPILNLGLSAERGGTDQSSENVAAPEAQPFSPTPSSDNSYALTANLSYELNLWGQLSDAKRASAYRYAAQQAEYQKAQQDLMLSLSNAWFDLISANELIRLFENRLINQRQNLKAIESRYRSGINSALDVYLARNNVAQEKSNLSNQRTALQTAKRAIQVLLKNYPSANIFYGEELPSIDSILSNINGRGYFLQSSLPSTLLTYKPGLQSAWLNVLVESAEVAMAHKARFPSLTLNASARQSSDSFGSLSNNGILSWSIGASLLQPILSSGRLAAEERVARLLLEQAELEYINTVYNTFNVVENALTQQSALNEQLEFTQTAATNAVYAEELAFEQYQKGLVNFTTVLEAQRRSFDSQAQLVSLKTQIAKNSALLMNEFVATIDIDKNDN